jgi:activator of HSP90 ATPase
MNNHNNTRRYFMMKRFSTIVAVIVTICIAQFTLPARQKQDSMARHTGASAAADSITIHQEMDFSATPQRLYEALLDAGKFSEFSAQSGEFTKKSAKIDKSVGGVFSLFDGHIIGRNVELVKNQRIVQAWRVVDWPAGAYSIVKFEMKAQGTGTHLVFDHMGFPFGLRDHLAAGWQSHYWDPLKKYFH